jgi:hypothetical protein
MFAERWTGDGGESADMQDWCARRVELALTS